MIRPPTEFRARWGEEPPSDAEITLLMRRRLASYLTNHAPALAPGIVQLKIKSVEDNPPVTPLNVIAA